MATGMLKNDIRKVKDLIESRQFIQALMLIKELESEYPSSAQVLVLKALVYAITGHTKALSICSDAIMEALTDTSVLPDVLKTSQIICQILGDEVSATILYRKAMAKDSNNLDLLMGLFQCYVRESSFIDQLLISLNMYKLSRENKFLMLAVFSVQLQVVSHLVKKHATTHNLDEPENLLVYISVPKQQGEYNHAREILSLLGTTLLVAEVSKLHIKGDMLLARLSDYVAAMEILRQKSETCPDDWQLFLNDLIELLDDDSEWYHPPLVLTHKLSQLSEDEFMQNQFGTNLSEALTVKLANLSMEVHGCLGDTELDEVADEYFNRLGSDAKVSLHFSRKSEELQLINNLRKQNTLTPTLLWKEVENFLSTFEEGSGVTDDVSAYHGTSMALKTSRFIILAADSKVTTKEISSGLNIKADKVWGFSDMGFGICGSWTTLSKTDSMLKRHLNSFEDNGLKRPTVSKLAKSLKEKLSSCEGESGIILGAFDQLEGGGDVPCISFADGHSIIDVNESFFCLGTGESHAEKILSEGKVYDGMSLEDAIDLVERALLYASVCDGFTGGYASIYVIEVGKPVKAITRERICTTLWRRHHLSLPGYCLKRMAQHGVRYAVGPCIRDWEF